MSSQDSIFHDRKSKSSARLQRPTDQNNLTGRCDSRGQPLDDDVARLHRLKKIFALKVKRNEERQEEDLLRLNLVFGFPKMVNKLGDIGFEQMTQNPHILSNQKKINPLPAQPSLYQSISPQKYLFHTESSPEPSRFCVQSCDKASAPKVKVQSNTVNEDCDSLNVSM